MRLCITKIVLFLDRSFRLLHVCYTPTQVEALRFALWPGGGGVILFLHIRDRTHSRTIAVSALSTIVHSTTQLHRYLVHPVSVLIHYPIDRDTGSVVRLYIPLYATRTTNCCRYLESACALVCLLLFSLGFLAYSVYKYY